MAREDRRARPPADISPAEFFTRWVPEAVAGDESRRRKLGSTRAVIVFDLQGHDGGLFAVEIEDGILEAREGDRAEADLRVSLDVETWRALNDGSLSAPEALLRRRLKFEGDALLGLKLHLMLG